jgi:hypothetical protein
VYVLWGLNYARVVASEAKGKTRRNFNCGTFFSQPATYFSQPVTYFRNEQRIDKNWKRFSVSACENWNRFRFRFATSNRHLSKGRRVPPSICTLRGLVWLYNQFGSTCLFSEGLLAEIDD